MADPRWRLAAAGVVGNMGRFNVSVHGRGRRAFCGLSERALQQVDVIGNNLPDSACIGTEIFVDNSVADAGNCPTGNVGMCFLERWADILRGLPMTATE
jgi:hypothetical protein